jgi:hypothetical protein
MTRSGLIRWGGLAAMLAGVAFAGFALLGIAAGGPNALLPSLVFALAFGLLAVGFVGFHALQKADYGLIGRVAYYILVVLCCPSSLSPAWCSRCRGASPSIGSSTSGR